jgi:hypothetical protein
VTYWKPILAAVVIFAAGAITGALALHLGRPAGARPGIWAQNQARSGGWNAKSPQGPMRDLAARMAKELKLSPAQRERVEVIVREAHARVRALADEIAPRTRVEFKQMEADIRALLNPAQAARYDAMCKEREKMFRRGERHPPGDGPPDAPAAGGP